MDSSELQIASNPPASMAVTGELPSPDGMKVRDLFARFRGLNVSLLPNDGNCGDGLIYMGLQQLCREYGIGYTELLYPRPASGRILLVLGCGNLCQPFHFQINKIRHYAGHFERIYILPSSIDPDSPEVADFFGNPPPNLSVFCRERISFEKVTAITARPETVFLDHDLAMAVDYTPWRQRGSGNLNAFRTDRESMGHAVPADNMDVSLWGGSSDGGMLLRTVAEYRTVHTDRAHVAICAARLGKETHVYPNNYHKVRGIFEYSLRGLPDVCFHEQREM